MRQGLARGVICGPQVLRGQEHHHLRRRPQQPAAGLLLRLGDLARGPRPPPAGPCGVSPSTSELCRTGDRKAGAMRVRRGSAQAWGPRLPCQHVAAVGGGGCAAVTCRAAGGPGAGWHLLPQRAHRLGRPGPRPGHAPARALGDLLAGAVAALLRRAGQGLRRRAPLESAAAAAPGRRRGAAPAPHEPDGGHRARAAVAAGVGRLFGGGRRLLHGAALGACVCVSPPARPCPHRPVPPSPCCHGPRDSGGCAPSPGARAGGGGGGAGSRRFHGRPGSGRARTAGRPG